MNKPNITLFKAPSLSGDLGALALKSQEFELILICLNEESFSDCIAQLNAMPVFIFFVIEQAEDHIVITEKSTSSVVLICDYRKSITFTLKKWRGLKVRITGLSLKTYILQMMKRTFSGSRTPKEGPQKK